MRLILPSVWISVRSRWEARIRKFWRGEGGEYGTGRRIRLMPTVDVLVVGAGPAGLNAARRLAAEGFSVSVLEEHPVIGEPVDCSGVIGADGFDGLGLPHGPILGELRVLRLVSPGGIAIAYRNGGPLAYVTERGRFDKALAAMAEAAGV